MKQAPVGTQQRNGSAAAGDFDNGFSVEDGTIQQNITKAMQNLPTADQQDLADRRVPASNSRSTFLSQGEPGYSPG